MDRQHATLTTLWTFHFLAAWWLSIRHFPCIHPWTFTSPTIGALASGQNPDFIPHQNGMIRHLLLRLQPFSCPHIQLFALHLSNLYSEAVAILQILDCCCLCRLLTARCSHFFPHRKDIWKYSAQIWSIDEHTTKFIRFQTKEPNRTVLPLQRFNYAIDLQNANWAVSSAVIDSFLKWADI